MPNVLCNKVCHNVAFLATRSEVDSQVSTCVFVMHSVQRIYRMESTPLAIPVAASIRGDGSVTDADAVAVAVACTSAASVAFASVASAGAPTLESEHLSSADLQGMLARAHTKITHARYLAQLATLCMEGNHATYAFVFDDNDMRARLSVWERLHDALFALMQDAERLAITIDATLELVMIQDAERLAITIDATLERVMASPSPVVHNLPTGTANALCATEYWLHGFDTLAQVTEAFGMMPMPSHNAFKLMTAIESLVASSASLSKLASPATLCASFFALVRIYSLASHTDEIEDSAATCSECSTRTDWRGLDTLSERRRWTELYFQTCLPACLVAGDVRCLQWMLHEAPTCSALILMSPLREKLLRHALGVSTPECVQVLLSDPYFDWSALLSDAETAISLRLASSRIDTLQVVWSDERFGVPTPDIDLHAALEYSRYDVFDALLKLPSISSCVFHPANAFWKMLFYMPTNASELLLSHKILTRLMRHATDQGLPLAVPCGLCFTAMADKIESHPHLHAAFFFVQIADYACQMAQSESIERISILSTILSSACMEAPQLRARLLRSCLFSPHHGGILECFRCIVNDERTTLEDCVSALHMINERPSYDSGQFHGMLFTIELRVSELLRSRRVSVSVGCADESLNISFAWHTFLVHFGVFAGFATGSYRPSELVTFAPNMTNLLTKDAVKQAFSHGTFLRSYFQRVSSLRNYSADEFSLLGYAALSDTAAVSSHVADSVVLHGTKVAFRLFFSRLALDALVRRDFWTLAKILASTSHLTLTSFVPCEAIFAAVLRDVLAHPHGAFTPLAFAPRLECIAVVLRGVRGHTLGVLCQRFILRKLHDMLMAGHVFCNLDSSSREFVEGSLVLHENEAVRRVLHAPQVYATSVLRSSLEPWGIFRGGHVAASNVTRDMARQCQAEASTHASGLCCCLRSLDDEVQAALAECDAVTAAWTLPVDTT
jgi:hypothetical protein